MLVKSVLGAAVAAAILATDVGAQTWENVTTPQFERAAPSLPLSSVIASAVGKSTALIERRVAIHRELAILLGSPRPRSETLEEQIQRVTVRAQWLLPDVPAETRAQVANSIRRDLTSRERLGITYVDIPGVFTNVRPGIDERPEDYRTLSKRLEAVQRNRLEPEANAPPKPPPNE
jgi:hypothetical protein